MVDVNVVILPEAKKVKLKNPLVVVGFPSPGLAGSVAAVHITEVHDFKLIGYFWGGFAPVAAVHTFKVMPPIRVMASEKFNMIAILSEISIPVSANSKIAELVVELARRFKARELVILSSIADAVKDMYVVASNPALEKELSLSVKVKPMKEGALSGVAPLALIKAAEKGMRAYILLAPSLQAGTDAKASLVLLKAVQNIYDVKFNLSELEQEAKKEAVVLDKEEETADLSGSSMYR